MQNRRADQTPRQSIGELDMTDSADKPKRKTKDKRKPDASSTFALVAGIFVLIFVVGLGITIALTMGNVSRHNAGFELTASQIALTNQALALILTQTSVSATQAAERIGSPMEATNTPAPTSNTSSVNAPQLTPTTCFWNWARYPDDQAAAELEAALIAAQIPVDTVFVENSGEDYNCGSGDHYPQKYFLLHDRMPTITFSQQAQTLDDETRGDLVAAVLKTLSTTKITNLWAVRVEFPAAKWQMRYADARAAHDSGLHGTQLWQMGVVP
jgi:hypothetical protein